MTAWPIFSSKYRYICFFFFISTAKWHLGTILEFWVLWKEWVSQTSVVLTLLSEYELDFLSKNDAHMSNSGQRLIDLNSKDDLDPLKKLLVIAAGAQRRPLHYWGAHDITEVFGLF